MSTELEKEVRTEITSDLMLKIRMDLWEWSLLQGWVTLGRHNCLYKEDYMLRLNFQDPSVLKLERRQIPTLGDRHIQPGVRSKWIALKTQSYDKISIRERDLDWGDDKTSNSRNKQGRR